MHRPARRAPATILARTTALASALALPPILAATPARAAAPGPRDLATPRRLTLTQALALARAEDAPLAAADERLADATTEAARTYPFNPFVQFQVLPYTSAGAHLVADYILVMQTLELGRQHRWRRAAGRASADQLRAARDQAQLAEAVAVARLFFAALYQRGLHELARRRLALADEPPPPAVPPAADQRVLDLLARQALRNDLELAALARADAESLLALRLRLPVGAPLDLVGDLGTWPWPRLPPAPLLDLPHPDLAALDAASAAARASWNLARAARIPSLAIGPYYQRSAAGDTSVGFRGQVELPVLNAGRRLERLRAADLARRELAAARAREDQARRAALARTRYARLLTLALGFRADLDAAIAGATDSLALRDAHLRAERVQLDLMFQVAQAAVDLGESTDLQTDALGLQP